MKAGKGGTMNIKLKMMLIISGVVALAILPLSLIVLYRNEAIITEKTFEVCRNISQNIAKASTEELLMDVTFDSTRSVIEGLKEAEIGGLLSAYVLNHEGKIVSAIGREVGQFLPKDEMADLGRLQDLTMDEIRRDKNLLRFIYPIFIRYKNSDLRVGTAVFEFEREKVYEPIAQTRQTIIWVSGIVFTIALAVAILSAVLITRPILSLSEGVKIFGSGNLAHRIEIQSKDEIGHLARSFNDMAAKLHDFTQNLEEKVRQRTKELNETLQQVQALKEQQDGDYFLTSLLTKPLQSNNNPPSHIITDFIVEQKKKFSFRHRQSEIGGDLCTTDVITINRRPYTVVINADAMGKSIQGAGGTLVLGAAFKAHIIQAKLGKSRARKPEIWLRDTYRDLQNIFESFDGSMYISILLGLVDQQNGFFYFINAEHPATILYRDGVASFLDDSQALRKLGTPGEAEKLVIRTFQLMPGDIIITGSDGRDDIILTKEDGTEYINEDETLILRLVEKAKGDIHTLAKLIKETGKLMDDLSLLSIKMSEDAPTVPMTTPEEVEEVVRLGESELEAGHIEEAMKAIEPFVQKGQKFPELLYLLGRIYYKNKQYEEAANCFEQLTVLQPDNNEVLYLLSYIRGLQGNLEAAADYGECLYLREKENKLNLLHLARIYFEMGILPRASYLLNRLLSLDPNFPEARKLLKEVQEAKAQKVDEYTLEQIKSFLKEAEREYRKKNWHRAYEAFARVVVLDTNHELAWYKMGVCAFHTRNFKSAAEDFRKVLLINPENKTARNNLAVALFYLGNKDEAREELRKVLERYPDYETARENLEQLEQFPQQVA
ncbi:MAG: tetratricopeptide repeat protein [Leptospiraceae bacterium]|nr:tetratricopeptide repeat protein [Leptospiraceae bacterium]MDW8307044.1 tetratricopeptide repeat protein [Leptospiraceae bacterium]